MAAAPVLDFNDFADPSTAFDSGAEVDPFAFVAETANDDLGMGVMDLSGVDENAKPARPIFPAGTYDAVIDDCQYKKSKAGKPMLAITWKAYHPSDLSKTVKVFDYLLMETEFQPRLKYFLMVVAPEIDLTNFKPNLAAFKLIGKNARLRLKIEVYENQPSNKIDGQHGILPPSSQVPF
jgi:hypothetical protein